LGIAGVSFAVAGAAHASTPATTADVPAQKATQQFFLGEEEMSDVSLSTFYVFDKENAATSNLGQKTAWWGCGRCGCGRCGCGWRGCGGCGGCGGCPWCWSRGGCHAC
jgi:hypothetical protein